MIYIYIYQVIIIPAMCIYGLTVSVYKILNGQRARPLRDPEFFRGGPRYKKVRILRYKKV